MNKQIKKRLTSFALAGVMAISMTGCKNSEQSQNENSSVNVLKIDAELEENTNEINNENSSINDLKIVAELEENTNEINNIKHYSAKNICVVTATTLSGNTKTYLARPYNTLTKVYYLELKTGCTIERVNKVTELVKYLDVEELKEEYTELEIMELYSQIVGCSISDSEYPVSRYVDCPVEVPQKEEYNAAYLHLLVGKDENGKEELYLVKHKNYPFISSEIYDFFTGTHLKSYYEFISSLKWAPLCEYIPLSNRKENYTSEELRVILDYARQVFHKDVTFNINDSIDLRTLEQKYSEEQILVLDTSKLMNFGETEDTQKNHVLLLTYANEDKTVFNYSELGSNTEVANLIIDENGYTLCYYEPKNGVAYIANSEIAEDGILPLNEFLIKNGYEDSVNTQAFTLEELQSLEQSLQNKKILTLSIK